jgi:hypothetical protein
MDSKETDLKRIETAAKALGEFYDSVHIFATRHESGEANGTVNLSWGEGNWFSRYGQIRDWLIRQEERAREIIRREDDPQ